MDPLVVRVIEDRAESGRRVVHTHAAVRAKCTHLGEKAAVAAIGDFTDSGVGRAIRADADAVAHMGNGFPFVTYSKAAQYVPEAHVSPLKFESNFLRIDVRRVPIPDRLHLNLVLGTNRWPIGQELLQHGDLIAALGTLGPWPITPHRPFARRIEFAVRIRAKLAGNGFELDL